MSVVVPETFESTAIIADNFCTRVQDGHAGSTAEVPSLD